MSENSFKRECGELINVDGKAVNSSISSDTKNMCPASETGKAESLHTRSLVFDGNWPFRMSLKTWSDSTEQATYFFLNSLIKHVTLF